MRKLNGSVIELFAIVLINSEVRIAVCAFNTNPNIREKLGSSDAI